MPFFDYECSNCGYERSKLLKEAPQKVMDWCEGCGSGREFVKKLSAPIGFNLKGNGFYKPSAAREQENPKEINRSAHSRANRRFL